MTRKPLPKIEASGVVVAPKIVLRDCCFTVWIRKLASGQAESTPDPIAVVANLLCYTDRGRGLKPGRLGGRVLVSEHHFRPIVKNDSEWLELESSYLVRGPALEPGPPVVRAVMGEPL